MRTKLLIHVGSHKTGTTSIQSALAANRAWLRQNGVYYPDPRPFFFGKSDAHHAVAHFLAGRKKEMQEVDAARFIEHLKSKGSEFGKLLLSAEPFYRHVAEEPGVTHDDGYETVLRRRESYVMRMAEYFRDFDTEIVLSLRRQDSFAESLYRSSVVSTRYTGGFPRFIQNRSFKYDYDMQIGLFSRYFDNVTYDSYERSLVAGLVPSFLERIGLTSHVGFTYLEHDHLRQSISNKATLWIDRCKEEFGLSRVNVNRRWLFALVSPPAVELTKSTFWPSKEARDAFLERYRSLAMAPHFLPPGSDTMPVAALTGSEFLTFNEAFDRWESENTDYLARREARNTPPYVPDESAKPRPEGRLSVSKPSLANRLRNSYLARRVEK